MRISLIESSSFENCAVAKKLLLWRVQADSLRKHLTQAEGAARVRAQVSADVRRAARLIDAGLHGFAATATPESPAPPAG